MLASRTWDLTAVQGALPPYDNSCHLSLEWQPVMGWHTNHRQGWPLAGWRQPHLWSWYRLTWVDRINCDSGWQLMDLWNIEVEVKFNVKVWSLSGFLQKEMMKHTANWVLKKITKHCSGSVWLMLKIYQRCSTLCKCMRTRDLRHWLGRQLPCMVVEQMSESDKAKLSIASATFVGYISPL